MKKTGKKLTALCLSLGILAIGATSITAFAAGNPYETYKSAIVQLAKQESDTTNGTIEVKENGSVIASGTLMTQDNGGTNYSKLDLVMGSETIDAESHYADGVLTVRNGDQYFTDTQDKRTDRDGDNQNSPNAEKLQKMMADLIIGDAKNQFTTQGDVISLHLDSAQVPELANVAFAALAESKPGTEKLSAMSDVGLSSVYNLIENTVLDIRTEATVKSIDLVSTVKGGAISEHKLTIVLTGKDSAGQNTEVEVTYDFTVSAVGSTTPQTIDTTGKDIQQMNLRMGR